MTEEWVKLWYQCLHGSDEYSDYCAARFHRNAKLSGELEERFPQIREIYKDFSWGGSPWDGTDARWAEWFEPRRGLFMHTARVLPYSSKPYARHGYLSIEVPVLEDAMSTAEVAGELVKEAIAKHFASHTVHTVPGPRYSLHMKDGRPAHGFEQVRKACVAATRISCYLLDHSMLGKQFDPGTDFLTNFVDAKFVDTDNRLVVTQFALHELDNMGWSLDPRAREELLQKGTLPDERFQSFKAMLNRSLREFRLLAANAIQGRFPDMTPQP